MNAWAWLFAAGIMEVAFVCALKEAQGFSRPGLVALAFGFGLASFGLLAKASAALPMNVAYGVWVGLGLVGALAVEIVLHGARPPAGQLFFAGLLTISIVGLRVTQ